MEQQEQPQPHQQETLTLIKTMSTTQQSSPSRRLASARLEETWLFFASAVGCTIGWTAVLSNLVYYTDTLGVNSYLYLNLAIYAPLFPITVAQTLWDAEFDRQYSSLKTFQVRGSIGFALMLVSVMGMAKASSSLTWATLLALCLGTASGILHGALKQMASFVYPGCGRLAAAVTAGLQASAVAVLMVSLVFQRQQNDNDNNNSSSSWLYYFYGTISVLVALCWLSFQRLMTHSRDVYRSMLRRDSSIQLSALGQDSEDELDQDSTIEHNNNNHTTTIDNEQRQTLLSADCSPSSSFDLNDNNHDDDDNDEEQVCLEEPLLLFESPLLRMPSTRELLWHSWPLCLAVFLTVASSMAVASWFNRVPSDRESLPQVLFYTRLFADLLSRPATLWLPQLQSSNKILWYLMALVFLRLLFVPYFFIYTTNTTNLLPRSDVTMTLGVFGFAFSSGFITTLVYQLAPRYCPTTSTTRTTAQLRSASAADQEEEEEHPSDNVVLKQTNLLNVCFSASVLLGLLGSLSLSGIAAMDGDSQTIAV
ncbi:expressed unknown protein [Seminavis robusta]|uniref:Uncharacterized protein n=1 Tax=Seminavis robusta TaxID=568900 RepID=A0A9N8HQG0_9STRA|nr:expressed unknown protein [Seminavis robusta]|eukprot:Sro981_g227550.1 n/a (536) ;mRNA; r:25025-26632